MAQQDTILLVETQPITVFVADRHPAICMGVRTILAPLPDYEVVADAVTGQAARQLGRSLQPDLILLDPDFPDLSAYELIASLQTDTPVSKIIIFAEQAADLSAHERCQSGIAGYILKTESGEAIVDALRIVTQGGVWFSQSVIETLLRPIASQPPIAPLTPRELALVVELITGKPDKQIAQALGIGERTVRHLLQQIYHKWGVDSRIEVAVQAVRSGVV